MWRKREPHILEIYKNDQLAIKQNLIRKSNPSNETHRIYQGNEFDVFGKKDSKKQEQFAPPPPQLYSKEQFTFLPRAEQKRRHVEATVVSSKKMKIPPIANHVFFKSTAAINSPVASIFADPKQDDQDQDLAYY